MSDLILMIISDIAFGIFTFIISYVIYAFRIKKSVKILLQISIYNLYKGCDNVGYKTLADSMAFKELINQYYSLKGNSYIEDVERRFNLLPEKYE